MSPVELHGRHPTDRPRGPVGFLCPACGAENTGALDQGCSTCGSGKPGQHVGVPPPAIRSRTADPELAFAAEAADILGRGTEAGTIPVEDRMDAVFLAWVKPLKVDQASKQLLYDAFKAGYQCGIGAVTQQELPLSGTAETRTIIAALRLFIEHVLPTATEEISSGEFLSIAETQRMIQKLERTQ